MFRAVLQHEQFAWAVTIGDDKFAADGNGVRWITGRKRDAQAFAKELRPHVGKKCTAVRVRVLIETAE